MRTLLNKIFLQKLGLGKFVLSGLAFLVGFSLVLLALQGYIRINEYLKPGKGTSNFIIISKEVVMANTILGSRAQFSAAEIDDLRKQPFVEDLGEFKSNTFEVVAHAGGQIGLYTELFFEAVPERFIDKVPPGFSWSTDTEVIPIIISQDFLDLYNFGYALGKGAPQLSKSTIQLVPFEVELRGEHSRRVMEGKVAGFSERIPSVLVPEEFLEWANDNIGNPTREKISRVIIKVKTGGSSALVDYLKKNELIVGGEKMKLGKLLTTLDILSAAIVLIGVGFMGYSLVIVVMNFSLMVAQAREEVSLLLQLGYHGGRVALHLTQYLIFFLIVSIGLSSITWWLANGQFVDFLSEHGIDITKAVAPQVVLLAIGFVLIFFAVSFWSIRRLITRQGP